MAVGCVSKSKFGALIAQDRHFAANEEGEDSMSRSVAGWSAILVCLALGVALLGVGSDNLILTPAPIIDLVRSAPIVPDTPSIGNSSDETIEEGAAGRIVPGSQRIWGDGVRSPRLE